MEYLTTHDLVWINSLITGAVNPYNYVTLEAAMAGQYRYGDSQEVAEQAANLLDRLVCTRPFSAGNVRTALIATLTFLNANGYATTVSDAAVAEVVRALADGKISRESAIAELAAPAEKPIGSIITLRQLMSHEIHHHLEALTLLASDD